MPPFGDISDDPDAPKRLYVKAHSNVFGLTTGEEGWIANDEEAVEAVRLGFISLTAPAES